MSMRERVGVRLLAPPQNGAAGAALHSQLVVIDRCWSEFLLAVSMDVYVDPLSICPLFRRPQNQNQNQIYSLEQYTVIPTATYSFVPPRCRRGRLAAAFPRPHLSGRLAPASAWAVWPWSLPPVCSFPRVCYLSIAI